MENEKHGGAQPREDNRLLTTLGLCARARALIFGTDMVCDAMRRGVSGKTPLLVIEASDTSERTHKKLTDKCGYYKVRHVVVPFAAVRLGAALGRERPLAAAGVTDARLVRAVEAQIDRTGRAR